MLALSKLAGVQRKVTSAYYYKRTNKFAVKLDGKEVFQALPVRPNFVILGCSLSHTFFVYFDADRLEAAWRAVILTRS